MERLLLQDEQNFVATENFYKIHSYTQEHQLRSDSEAVLLYRMCCYLQRHSHTATGSYVKPHAQNQCREIRQNLRDYAAKYKISQAALHDLNIKTIGTHNAPMAKQMFEIIKEINGQQPD